MASDYLLQIDGIKGESESRHANPFLAYAQSLASDCCYAADDIGARSSHLFGEFDLA